MYKKYLKRTFDILFSFVLLLILLPLIVLISCIIYADTGASPFFTQKRPGKKEVIFSIFKFKTMNDNTDSDGNPLPDGERLTALGAILRKTSLDEIPQLYNVLKGEMSFIGPRPLLVDYLPFYTINERKRHYIRPGITGLAQVSGRNLVSWDKRLAMDVAYYDELSLWNDIKIIIKTLQKVVTSQDVIVDGSSMIRLDMERSISATDEKKTEFDFPRILLKIV